MSFHSSIYYCLITITTILFAVTFDTEYITTISNTKITDFEITGITEVSSYKYLNSKSLSLCELCDPNTSSFCTDTFTDIEIEKGQCCSHVVNNRYCTLHIVNTLDYYLINYTFSINSTFYTKSSYVNYYDNSTFLFPSFKTICSYDTGIEECVELYTRVPIMKERYIMILKLYIIFLASILVFTGFIDYVIELLSCCFEPLTPNRHSRRLVPLLPF